MDIVEIYFFSGTGNTLFLVKELKKRIPQALLRPIASFRFDSEVVPQSKKIGFCFPNHGGQIPAAMRLFIQKLKLQGDEYLFALVSSGGTGCNAFESINRIVRKKSLRLSGEFLLNMPSFNPKTDDVATLPDVKQIEDFRNLVPEKLDRIADALKQNLHLTDSDAPAYQLPPIIEKFLAPLVLSMVAKSPSFLKDYFYVDSNCTGCGTCEKVCQTGRISIHDFKPMWNINIPCYCCHACLAFCPCGSIQVKPRLKWAGSKTAENPRFKPPFASVNDIGRQKDDRVYNIS
jgi:ferredoxin